MTFDEIYRSHAAEYDELVRYEDCDREFEKALLSICDWEGKIAVEFGAGTCRVTSLLLPHVSRIYAFDRSQGMLAKGIANCSGPYLGRLCAGTADNFNLPLASSVADIAVEGWSFGHSVVQAWESGSAPERLEKLHETAGRLISEMERVCTPNGDIVVVETLGTGLAEPKAPTETLSLFYEWLERERGFSRTVVRTDYLFPDVATAKRLLLFFFGDWISPVIDRYGSRIPECTGIWHKKNSGLACLN